MYTTTMSESTLNAEVATGSTDGATGSTGKTVEAVETAKGGLSKEERENMRRIMLAELFTNVKMCSHIDDPGYYPE